MIAFSHEVKDNLARLLATENLIVEHKQVSTASFDVQERVLTLPMWQKASSIVYDLLVGHEVGHALYTPNIDWREDNYKNVPPSFVNVVEDARIERLMKRKFPGFAKTFHKGYKELSDDDFFSIADEDLSKMNLIDRINLHFKIGLFTPVPFSQEENKFVELVETSETFADVLEVSLMLFEHVKKENEDRKKTDLPFNPEQTNSEPSSNSSVTEVETPNSEQSDLTGDSEGDSEGSGEEVQPDKVSSTPEGGLSNDFESQTESAFEKNQKKLINHGMVETTYVEFPEVILNNVVIPTAEISELCKNFYSTDFVEGTWRKEVYEQSVNHYAHYKKDASRGVSYLVKEFECKKSADAYARAATSRTGVLDTSKLHTYKYNDDLFKKVTIIPDGKSHGLVFVLDWSGSMQDVILDTVKQLLNLVWFCKKVNIPFEVYAFTYDYSDTRESYEDDGSEIQVLENNTLYMYRNFRLLNMLSHTRNSAEFEGDCKNIFTLAYAFQKRSWDLCPAGLGLSGTPLNESLIVLRQLLPKFIKDNKLQKVNTVILTDGESASIARVVKTKDYYDKTKDRWGRVGLNTSCQIRDRKIGRVYKPSWNDHYWKGGVTHILLTNLRENLPQVNFIGIRVLPSRDVANFFYTYAGEYSESTKKVWKKNRSFIIKDNGYDALYAMSSTSLNESDDFEVSDDATNAQIRTAFKKSLKAKTLNKKILSSFIEYVA
jgi:hypothetical protein